MSKMPVTFNMSWFRFAALMALLLVFIVVGAIAGKEIGIIIAGLTFAFILISLRLVFGRYHSRGLRYYKRQQFEKAIAEFKKSLDFFRAHEWVDRYRIVTMLSPAELAFREIAMISIGSCYAQLGDIETSREFYEECLKEFPESMTAKSALRFIEAAKN